MEVSYSSFETQRCFSLHDRTEAYEGVSKGSIHFALCLSLFRDVPRWITINLHFFSSSLFNSTGGMVQSFSFILPDVSVLSVIYWYLSFRTICFMFSSCSAFIIHCQRLPVYLWMDHLWAELCKGFVVIIFGGLFTKYTIYYSVS